MTAVTDPAGNTTRTDYDTYGRVTERTDPLGRTTHWTYDLAGNLTAVTRPDGLPGHRHVRRAEPAGHDP